MIPLGVIAGQAAGAPPPGVPVYSQSSLYPYNPDGVLQAASAANMRDNSASVFTATDSANGAYVQATFPALSTVSSVKIGSPPETTDGWGGTYMNGILLQGTADASPGPGSAWTTLATLGSMSNATITTLSVSGEYTALRLTKNGYVVASEFAIS